MTDTRPHVFHLITRLLKGGAEAKTIATVTGLDGYEFTVGFGASADRGQIEKLDRECVATRQFPLLRHYNLPAAVPAVVSIARYLRRKEFDIVHTHSTEAGIIGRFAAALADVPHVVHTVHGVPFSDDRNHLLNRFVLACERAAAKRTDRMVTNADVIADEYLEYGIGTRGQYVTVYSGVDIASFETAEPANELPGTRPRVLMVGRLVDGKGFDVLLDAADVVGKQEGSVCIVGDGPLYGALQSAIEHRGLSETVYMTGYREDIPRVLAASDILVLPSFREGTPRVISEAMASGLPVIATDIAGIPEQIVHGESGYLIPTGNSDELATRLDELLADSGLRERMGAFNKERVERFSVETMLADLDELYCDLLQDDSAAH